MPITKSAKKAVRQEARRRARNKIYERKIKDTLKEAREQIANKKGDPSKILPKVYKILDKAAKAGIIKKNTASRKKARISRAFSKSAK